MYSGLSSSGLCRDASSGMSPAGTCWVELSRAFPVRRADPIRLMGFSFPEVDRQLLVACRIAALLVSQRADRPTVGLVTGVRGTAGV
jgi:hypothetical protein